MTTLRSFTPDPEVYATYRVRLWADYYDHSLGELEPVIVHAIGVDGARRTALDTVKDTYPDAGFIQAQQLDIDQLQADGAQESTYQECPHCIFAMSVHDLTDRYAKQPYGCPTETIARARWGR